MKKLLATVLIALASLTAVSTANAQTWWYNGVYYGNICRNGAYYTVYPVNMGQPVGTSCPIRNGYGQIVGYGVVADE
jgi:hypothetical protein